MEESEGIETGMIPEQNIRGSTSTLGPVSSHDYDLQQSNIALLKAELKLVTHERDLLKKELMRVPQHHTTTGLSGSTYKFPISGTLPRINGSSGGHSQSLGDRSWSTNSVRDYDALQKQCEAAMSELQSLKRQHERCERAMQESEYYRGQHRSVLTKLDSTTQEMHNLRAKYGDILAGKQRLEQEVHSLSQAREEDRKEIIELRRQQQESVIKGNGSSETLNQLYMNTLRKYEAIRDEHDSLRKRYADLVASHSAAVSKLELAQEEMTRLKKQHEESIQERNGAVRERNVFKQQCTQAIMQWDNAIRECNTYKDFLAKMQLQHEEEVNQAMAVRIKANKEIKRLTEERNAAMEEYSLVMRERDTVHKEIEKLQDDLSQSNKKLKNLESKNNELNDEKKMLLYQVESLRREILSALHDRDMALKELNDVKEKCGEYQESSENSAINESERNIYGVGSGIGSDQLRCKDRVELPNSIRGDLYVIENGDQQEVEQLRKQLEKLQSELQEACQEAEVSKRRRDWAFGERDKVVLERESIRTLCDRLRRERDRAVSDLAEALRDSDDIKRQRNDACKELKELKEKLGELQLEKDKEKAKDSRAPHNHSYDSALGTDLSDAETETLEVELDYSSGLMDFGFSLAGGRNNPVYSNDTGLYVVSVTRGGSADGKLKVNDCIIKIGNVNCATVDSETVWNVLRSSKMPVVLTLKRRRSLTQGLYSVKLHANGGIPHGLVLENGIYIRAITPGSIAARESTLKSGDRLCSINGRSIDSMSSFNEVCRILDDAFNDNGSPVVTVMRGSPSGFPLSLPSLGSPSSSSSAHNITEDDSHGDPHYPSGRRDAGSKLSKGSSSSNTASNNSNVSLAPGGFIPAWEIIREKLSRMKRPQNKERNDSHGDGGSHKPDQTSLGSQNGNIEREAAAIAELENVIDSYKLNNGNSNNDSSGSSGSHENKAELNVSTLSRRSRVASNQKAVNKRDEIRINSGGTWPRYRSVSPFTSGEFLGGTLFHSYKDRRERLPLSVFVDASKSSKDDEATDYGSSSIHAPSDGSIDLSVVSGNLGKEALGRYLKKKSNTNSGTGCKSDGDSETGRSNQPTSVSVSDTVTSASGIASPVHIHAPPLNHFRIQSQLYGVTGPSSLHASLKYKYSHVHNHTHNTSPPRYSSPPPIQRPPTENPYDFPLILPPKPYTHAPSPSIDSIYPRPYSYTHVPYAYDNGRSSRPDIGHLPFDGVGSTKRDPQRIRIPSNQSVTSRSSIGRISSSSIERLSERGSPMPNFHVEVLSPGRPSTGSDNCASLNQYSWVNNSSTGSKFKPAPDELRRVYIEKSSEPLGIQIICRNSGGVFVSSVHQSSLAAQVGLQVGDQLLEVCGINMRSATYQLAASVLRQCGDSITMLVQYNPSKYQELQELSGMGYMGPPFMTSSSSDGDGNGENSHERSQRSQSGSPTPCNSPRPSRNNSNNSSSNTGKEDVIDSASSTLRSPLHLDRLIDRGSEVRSSVIRPPSIHGTLTRHHGMTTLKRPTSMVGSPGNEESTREREPRLVYLEMKKAHSLGISLVGGNAVGIYVHAVQPDSPAYKSGLRCGDRILEFNGINLREATAEQAAYELAKPAEKITLVVQHDLERYHEIAEQPGDSFYVKAQFDKLPMENSDPMELCFRRDDVLHVDNTMFNGVPGLWRAWLVDNEGRKIKCGVIPSKYKIEEELLQRSSLGDLDHDSRRSSTSARRSFFRRRKHTRSSSRDSKELASFSDASLQMGSAEGLGLTSTSSMQDNTPPCPLSYIRVDRLDCHVMRPVLIVGPLSDCVMEKLVQEFPRKFVRVVPEIMRVPQSYMEKGLEENVFVEYRRKGPHFECISVGTVQEICDKNLHGILDISLNAVERLQQQRLYPIVILLKFKSVKHIREVKDTRLTTDKMAAKAAKEMYEHVLKVEAEHRHLISAVIPAGGNLAFICTQVATVVDQEQNKILWVPHGSIW